MTALSPHSRQIEDSLLHKMLVAQVRDIIVGQNKTEHNLPVQLIRTVIHIQKFIHSLNKSNFNNFAFQ